ncbi:MAG: hypothetical protein GX308_04990 [Epulopiscium sp.]|nr:hypothetical protein [Candidatus Epulonipiscium sp.]
MIIAKRCYIGETIKNKDKILKTIANNLPLKNIYCLCVGDKPHHLMEILSSREMIKDIYSKEKYKIIGIASSRDEAFELTRQIMACVYKEYKDPLKIREFFALD